MLSGTGNCNKFTYMDQDDQKYVDALLYNDKKLLREIYEKFSGNIKSMILQQDGTETDAADIIQDALLAILNRAKKGGFVLTCPFGSFLYLVCKRRWIKELQRKNKIEVTISRSQTLYTNDDQAVAEDCILYKDRQALVVRMLEQLGEKCRQLLYLSWEGRPMEEVAALLNVSYGYARKKKTGCMTKLLNLIHQSSEYHSLK